MKAIKVFTALLMSVCLLWGCAASESEQILTSGELSITLPASFEDWSEDASAEGLAFSYVSMQVGVCGMFENKEYLQAYIPGLDAQQYAELFVETNGLSSGVTEVDGIPCFTYQVDGTASFEYLCGVFESDENFWVVQAYCAPEDFEERQSDMWRYIASVTIR